MGAAPAEKQRVEKLSVANCVNWEKATPPWFIGVRENVPLCVAE